MRYLPLTDNDRADMLSAIGVRSVDELFVDVPEAARFDGDFDLSDHMAEYQVEAKIAALAGRNVSTADVPSFLGAGAYRHHIPASVTTTTRSAPAARQASASGPKSRTCPNTPGFCTTTQAVSSPMSPA
ncbi:MAG: hypothetical protein HOG93_11805, partial [Rhodospirillaceae bacterium]|nr:hypothetical protein [Rhodospirillaceae bacterium]